jgi:hypothetical protein
MLIGKIFFNVTFQQLWNIESKTNDNMLLDVKVTKI